MWSQCINVEISSLLLWPIDPLLSDVLLYFMTINIFWFWFWFWSGLGYSYTLSTRTRSTRVLHFWYSYFTRTREFQIDSSRTCTRTHGQVLRYSYEYWHEYWYSMVHLWCKGENHHTCEIDNLTYHKRKVPNWFILLLKYDLNIWYMGCDSKFHRKSTELL